MRYDFSIENTLTLCKTDLIIAHFWTEGRFDKSSFLIKILKSNHSIWMGTETSGNKIMGKG